MTASGIEEPDVFPYVSRDPKPMRIRILAKRVLDGRYGLPSFQRNSVWPDEDKLELFNSIYNGVPIGVVYLWRCRGKDDSEEKGSYIPCDTYSRIGAEKKLEPFPSRCFDGLKNKYKEDKLTHLVLDGQQRLGTLALLWNRWVIQMQWRGW